MKKIEKTPLIRERLRKAVGPDVDLDGLTVYEAIALNTLPIRKQHPIFKGAVHSEDFLVSMSDRVNKESLPLHVNHESYELNLGRVFYGEVGRTPQGRAELRTLFFLPATAEKEINLIETGTIDQVSVSVLHDHMFCSKCDFDYMGEEADLDHFWTGTCKNGHTIGKNGTHVRLTGLNEWIEMSLVPQGGAQGARIQSPRTSKLSGEGQFKLAANGINQDALLLTTNDIQESQDVEVNLEKLVNEVVDVRVQLAALAASKETLSAQLDAANAMVVELNAKIETLNAEKGEVVALTARAEKAEGLVMELTGQVATIARKEAPADFGAAAEFIENTKLTLADLIKPGGTAKGSVEDVKRVVTHGTASVFQVRG